MKMLILHPADVPIDAELLKRNIHDEITTNSYPQGDGIAIIDSSKTPEWDWPDTVIRVGPVDIGRHHADATLDPGSDIESAVVDLFEQTTEAESNEDMVQA